MNEIAERYVRLVLALGQHDPDYVDAYYGPAEWKSAAEKEKKPLPAIRDEAAALSSALTQMPQPKDEIDQLRLTYLSHQLAALEARVRIVLRKQFFLGQSPVSPAPQDKHLTFDEESRALYDAVATTLPDAHFEKILAQLEQRLPGDGPLWQRYEAWRKPFVIPPEKLDRVFQLAIAECRRRTLAHLRLPPNESFTVEYVTDKPWGGYNWYKGNFRSVIQVNTDLPSYIDRAVDLAAHEGYPGHHVYNALLEKNLVRDRGWPEFSVYALFSPQSLIAEGTANFGKDVVFTPAERMEFERKILFPAAGIDPKRAADYYAVQDMMKELSYAGNEAARRLLDGPMNNGTAATWLEKYAVLEPARARQRIRFIERYRSYVINYNLGEDMVRHYIEQQGGTADQPEKRWRAFEQLLSSPRLPSGLR